MPKKFFKRWLPHSNSVKTHPKLQFFGTLLHEPNLWHLNRNSLAGGTAVGLFTAFLPIPMQMLIAAALAILFRVNLPLSMSLVWITNPVTIPPVFFFAYQLGCALLGRTPNHAAFHFSLEWIATTIDYIWQPLALGCVTLGFLSAGLGYLLIQMLWRLHVNHTWRTRRGRRLKKKPVIPPHQVNS